MGTAVAQQKYKGYAALSKYQDTDVDLGIVRRFGHLRLRNLLYYQDELADLEEQLQRLDLSDVLPEKEHRSRRHGKNPVRKHLMGCLREKLRAFGESEATRRPRARD